MESEVCSVESFLAESGGHESFVTTGRDVITEGVACPGKQRSKAGGRKREEKRGRGRKVLSEGRQRHDIQMYSTLTSTITHVKVSTPSTTALHGEMSYDVP